MIRVRPLTLVAALCAAAASSMSAQQAPRRSTAPFLWFASTNPVALVLGGVNGEIEGMITPDISLGVAGTYFSSHASGFDRGEHYGSFDVKAAFYPQGAAPNGYSFALTGGSVSYVNGSSRTSGGTIGFAVDRNLFLGNSRRFVVGLGSGIKRVVSGHADDSIFPSFRFQLGYAF